MGWDFSTDPEYQKTLDWVDEFVRQEVEPLDYVLGNPYDKSDRRATAIIRPLSQQVKDRHLWAAHLEQDLGGQGYGQLKLALLNELLGRSRWAPSVFGCQAPDSGNAEILARFGTPEQKARYLQPLLDGSITSCYSMTEPHAGADPTLFTTRAVRKGSHWVIKGEKWFSSNARYASFLIVMAVTDPTAKPHERMSQFIVPADSPGIEIIRNVGLGGEASGAGSHGYIRYEDVRVPNDALLGGEGKAFAIAQTRLGGGRVHHAMRTVGQLRKAFEMMCERALSRHTRTGPLAGLGVVQEAIADSWIEIEQFRLLVLRTAWLIDQKRDYGKVRQDIAAIKVAMPKVYHDVVQRAMHLHGALGVSNEMPLHAMLLDSQVMAVVDGPTEVHKGTIARQVLKDRKPAASVFPSAHIPARREEALRKLASALDDAAAAY
jgi:acyl-CoA dehydrogenase